MRQQLPTHVLCSVRCFSLKLFHTRETVLAASCLKVSFLNPVPLPAPGRRAWEVAGVSGWPRQRQRAPGATLPSAPDTAGASVVTAGSTRWDNLEKTTGTTSSRRPLVSLKLVSTCGRLSDSAPLPPGSACESSTGARGPPCAHCPRGGPGGAVPLRPPGPQTPLVPAGPPGQGAGRALLPCAGARGSLRACRCFAPSHPRSIALIERLWNI